MLFKGSSPTGLPCSAKVMPESLADWGDFSGAGNLLVRICGGSGI
jgi:hypothetical protein